MNKDKKATVIKTGQVITVYRLNNGNWCDSVNCTTQYKPNELTIHN